ncbi:MAG TPA: hypothetical protein VEI97_12030 [bacterium]|nr:hypothetical protein [bacterium]
MKRMTTILLAVALAAFPAIVGCGPSNEDSAAEERVEDVRENPGIDDDTAGQEQAEDVVEDNSAVPDSADGD